MSPTTLQPSEIRPSRRITQPPQSSAPDGRRVSALERRIARRLLRAIGSPPIGIVLWDGEEIADADPPLTHVVFHDRTTFWKVVLDPNYQFGEAYSDAPAGGRGRSGRLSGNDQPFSRGVRPLGQPRPFRVAASSASRRGQHRSRRAAKTSITTTTWANDFYRLWLDEDMVL